MIKCEKGLVEIKGSARELQADVAVLLRTVRKSIAKNFNEDIAKKLIKDAVELAMLEDDEIEKKFEENNRELSRMLTATLAKAILDL